MYQWYKSVHDEQQHRPKQPYVCTTVFSSESDTSTIVGIPEIVLQGLILLRSIWEKKTT